MGFQLRGQRWSTWIIMLILLSSLFFSPVLPDAAAHDHHHPLDQDAPLERLFLPQVFADHSWHNPIGVELGTAALASDPEIQNHLAVLKVGYVRLNGRISWQQLQPEEGGPIDWTVLDSFENELLALKSLGISPIVVVDDYPDWAVETRPDGRPSHCGPLLASKFVDYADFLTGLVRRYAAPEFGVHIWELGNEPDVDKIQFPDQTNSVFGCWGKVADPFFGGEHYGEMLKVVSPAIRSADPLAEVWLGGLLLDSPDTLSLSKGKPELFLKGVLEAGAGPYFDVLPFHVYARFNGQNVDQDNREESSPWYSLGGGVTGKASFLRSIMSQYDVEKPLFVNEIALICPEDLLHCRSDVGLGNFFNHQASYLVRTYIRGLNAGVKGYAWFTLDGPGWRNGALLDEDQKARPVYAAQQQMSEMLHGASFEGPVYYTPSVEAYSFTKYGQRIHVLWSRSFDSTTVSLPDAGSFFVMDQTGRPLPAVETGDRLQIQVGFEPVYLTLQN